MKKTIFIFLLILPLFCTGTQTPPLPVQLVENHPDFKPGSFIERIGGGSEIVLDHLKKLDDKDDYSFYEPSSEEIKLIKKEALDLPPYLKRILDEKLIGVYFVNNLLGSGLTEWVASENGTYSFIVLDPYVLKKGISELLTEKENTCFIQDSESDISIRINCGTSYSGFYYILLHEAVHVADYSLRITPYTDNTFRNFYSIKTSETSFTGGVWEGYSDTVGSFSFRNDTTFYGFRGGPKIPLSEAVEIYSGLEKSPFVSLYGSLNWAEDLAEYITFYHLVVTLDEEYTIEVYSGEDLIYSYEPFMSDEVLMRSESIKDFLTRVSP